MSCKNHIDILGCNKDNDCAWFDDECKERRRSRRLEQVQKKSYNEDNEDNFDDEDYHDNKHKEIEQKAVNSVRKKRLTKKITEEKTERDYEKKYKIEPKKYEQPKYESKKYEQPKYEEPKYDEPQDEQEQKEEQGWGSWLYSLFVKNETHNDDNNNNYDNEDIYENEVEYSSDYNKKLEIIEDSVDDSHIFLPKEKTNNVIKTNNVVKTNNVHISTYDKKAHTKPEWALKILNMKKIKNWTLQTDNIFSTADVTLVLPAKGPNNEDVIFKASNDIGMIYNEGNYMGEIRSRAKSYGMKHLGIPTILDKDTIEIELNGKRKKIGYYVTNNVGISLESIANAIGFGKYQFVGVPEFIGFKVPKVASIAQQLLKVLKVMHIPGNSLGLLHNDIKPGNVLYNSNDHQIYLIDFDTANAISSVISATGKTKGVPGSYEFTGTDCLSKSSPGPKCDLDALGQFLIWCSVGKLPWKNTRKNMDLLAKEKEHWRSLPFIKRPGLGPLVNSQSFIDFFTYIDTLKNYTPAKDINYDYLYNCFNDIAENPLSL